MKTQPLCMLLLFIFLLAGCAPSQPLSTRVSEPWLWQKTAGQQIHTEHYLIRTTVKDDDVLNRFCTAMEAAHVQYKTLVPDLTINDRSLECYLFATREQWAAYTIASTGRDAEIYLQMVQGGYTYRDRFVCYLGNELDLYPIATHEGFHQFIARNFLSRLPPSLEEGLACTFEGVQLHDTGVSVDRLDSPIRVQHLSRAYEGKWLIPLPMLLQLNAGDLIDKSSERIEGYYAQCWALGRMLQDDSKYSQGLQNMLTDIAKGTVINPIGPADHSGRYNPAAVLPMMLKYLHTDVETLQTDYLAYIHKITQTNIRTRSRED